MAAAGMPQYYELSWAILSTIGLSNVLVGLMVMGIAGFSMVSLVPLIVSVATAVANGMCFYAFYSDYPVTKTAVASAFADIFWLVGCPPFLSLVAVTPSHKTNTTSNTTPRSKKQAYPSTATPSSSASSSAASASSS